MESISSGHWVQLRDASLTYGWLNSTISRMSTAQPILDEYKNNYPKLIKWTSYANIMAIKVHTKQATNSAFTLPHVNMLVDLGLVPSYFYKYGPQEEDEDADEDTDEDSAAAAAIWSGGIDVKQQGDDDDNIVDEQQQGGDE
jgi:hypothetical protein